MRWWWISATTSIGTSQPDTGWCAKDQLLEASRMKNTLRRTSATLPPQLAKEDVSCSRAKRVAEITPRACRPRRRRATATDLAATSTPKSAPRTDIRGGETGYPCMRLELTPAPRLCQRARRFV